MVVTEKLKVVGRKVIDLKVMDSATSDSPNILPCLIRYYTYYNSSLCKACFSLV